MYQKLLTVTLFNSVYFTSSALMVSVSDLTSLYLSLLIRKKLYELILNVAIYWFVKVAFIVFVDYFRSVKIGLRIDLEAMFILH